MNTDLKITNIPHAHLYTRVRVENLDRSLLFYCNALGMQEVRREAFTDAEFTLVFIGFVNTDAQFVLTYNWGDHSYSQGTGYDKFALEVHDKHRICSHLSELGVKITRTPGPMTMAPDETRERETIAFMADPDGQRIELIQAS